MIIKIQGEQPFQVLSTNFTISASESGYDLYFSADGVNYSKLFTVGANVNRQVTQVAAGSYYYLEGNTDTVTVNWMANCYSGGDGGGSYVLPVASSDTLGGVKIGSGLTMSGDTLNANPGGYTLPTASENVLGGVKIGSGITIDENGVISAAGGAPSDYNAVKEQVSANTQNIETLSGVTSGLTEALSGKQGTLSAGNGIDLSGNTVSVKVGEGLAFSGGTLIVSGTSSNTKVVMLNKLSQQERLDLYNELSSLYDYNANGWSSAYTEDMYTFYLDLRTYADQADAQTVDRYEGFYPMECCRMHPTDYGGAAFFTGVEQDREGNGNLICIRFVIDYQGNADGPSTWWNNPPGDIPSIGTVAFGNDGRGGLTYDADNDCFLYDNGTVSTGDTSHYVEDVIDFAYLISLFNRDGKYEGFRYLINVHSLDVITGGTYYSYTAPTLSIRDITPYTIGDYTFQREVTFKYTDWELKIDIPDNNIGANLRITQA